MRFNLLKTIIIFNNNKFFSFIFKLKIIKLIKKNSLY